jgi:hypothetical protein
LILVLTLTTSGISASIANVISGEEDCCGDEAEGEENDSDRAPCPPLCHACPCSPVFAVPQVSAEPVVARASDPVTIELVLQPPVSPPGPGVFHPPRTV